jgi:hypothetical protein
LDLTVHEALLILKSGTSAIRFERLAKALPRPIGRSPLVKSATGTTQPTKPSPRTYNTGSEEVQALATRLVNQRQTFEAFHAAALEGTQLTEAGRSSVAKRNGSRWLKSNWQKAEEFVAANAPIAGRTSHSDTEVLDSWQGAVTRANVNHDNARRMATGLLDMATTEGRALVGLSLRDAADLINVSRGTAGRALLQLQALGLVEMAGEPTSRQASRYRLMHASLWTCAELGTVSPSLCGGVRQLTVPNTATATLEFARDLQADAWGTKGLGECGRLVYLELAVASQRGADVKLFDLTSSLCRSPRTISSHLAKLKGIGLARPLGNRTWAAEYRDPTDVAFDLGVAGLGAARQAQHRRERRDHSVRQVMDRLLSGKVPTGRPEESRRSPEENRSQNRRIRIPMTIAASKTALVQVAPIHLHELVVDISQEELN